MSKYIGVTWHALKGKWSVGCMVDYKRVYLGLFLDVREAAKAFNAYCDQHFLGVT